MVKQQIDVEILAADFEVYLLSHKSETGAQFDEELADVCEQPFFQFAFSGLVSQR
jgi:hypothetical protein